ncbi:hypothetical protein [Thalassotalea sp. SU-HH00458]|uniref:hypothetical protein n=1 Tax=Thalassotalea sp. SU-HH00458 TaxID=3127657 RepID=UPI003105CBDF
MMLLFIKKSLNYSTFQYTLFCLLFIVLLQSPHAFSYDNVKKIALSTLGSFETHFNEIKQVSFIEGQNVIGEVSIKPGEMYSVNFPFNVQSVRYLINNGSLINKGDTVATVEGFDVHHFIDEYKSAQTLFITAEKHYKTNKEYFKNNIIKSSQWLAITKNYFDLKLKFEHFQHQMAFLNIDENERVTLISPRAGRVKIPDLSENSLEGEVAFELFDADAIQVKVSLPLLRATQISHIKVSPNCLLKINNIENIADKYYKILWATPRKVSECNFTIGQVLQATLIENFNGFQINKSAVFEFEDINYIAIKLSNEVVLTPINIMGSTGGDYYFTSDENIANQKALISSVSILQGYLLKLGAE